MAHDKEKYEDFRRAVWERDYGIFIKDRKLKKGKDEWKSVCVFWKCLTNEERKQFLETHKGILYIMNLIDVAHSVPKSVNTKDKYNKDNAVLCNTIAHGHLDRYEDPLTGKPGMKKEQKYEWMHRMLVVAMDNQKVREGRNESKIEV